MVLIHRPMVYNKLLPVALLAPSTKGNKTYLTCKRSHHFQLLMKTTSWQMQLYLSNITQLYRISTWTKIHKLLNFVLAQHFTLYVYVTVFLTADICFKSVVRYELYGTDFAIEEKFLNFMELYNVIKLYIVQINFSHRADNSTQPWQ